MALSKKFVKPNGITNADVKDVIWSTSDEKVATVNQNGTANFSNVLISCLPQIKKRSIFRTTAA